MTKVEGPMFTMTASGKVGDSIWFMKWRGSGFRKPEERAGIAYVRGRGFPLISRTPSAVALKSTMSAAVSSWHDNSYLDAESRNSWSSAGSGLGLSGFNRYNQKFIENNPQRESPWNIPSPE